MTFRIGLLSAVENVIGRRRVAVSIAEAKRAPGRHPGLSHVTIFCLCLFQREALLGQTSPATLPNARISTGGRVRAIALQNDGKVIIGGRFESVNGIPRNNIARINVNGSLDQAWNPSPIDMNVKVLAIGGTNVFVGGRFVGLGLQTGLAKLSATETGARDAEWNPRLASGANIDALAVSDAYLYVGGDWLLDSPQWNLVRISVTGSGTLDNSWRPTTDYGVSALALDGTNLYVGGYFNTIGGRNRNGLAKVSTVTGAVDPVWNPNANFWSRVVNALVINGDDLYEGGWFFGSVGGGQVQNLAKLSASNGTIDPAWNPHPTWNPEWPGNDLGDFGVRALALIGNYLYVGGTFTNIGGHSKTNLARLSTFGVGEADASWDPALSGPLSPDYFPVETLAVNGSTIYAGGAFTKINGSTSLGLAKLGAIRVIRDDSFSAQVERPGFVTTITRQRDRKFIIGGRFDRVGGFARENLARFNSDGTVDPAWNPSANGSVSSIVLSGNDVFIAGGFLQVGNFQREGLAKLSAIGPDSPDAVWNPSPSFGGEFAPRSLAIEGTNLYVEGYITTGLTPKGHLTKLDATGWGQIDPAWNFPISFGSGWPFLVNERDLFVGAYGFPSSRGIYKLSASLGEAADTNWNPNASVVLNGLALAGTNLYVSGRIERLGGRTNISLVKVTIDGVGEADPFWNPPVATLATNDYSEHATILGISGTNLYVYGVFTNGSGEYRTNLVKLNTGGTGELDPAWNFPLASAESRLAGLLEGGFFARDRDVYVGGYGFAFFPVADAPSMVKRSPTSLVVLRNPDDGYEVTHFQITGITGGTLHQSRDITPINVGDFITTDQGEAGLIFAGAIDGTVSAVSSLNATTNGTGTASATLNFGAPQGPVFSFSSANYLVSKASNTVRITVRKWGGGAAEVNLTTADGTAVAYDSNSATGDYDALSSTQLRFPEGETNKSFNVGIINDQLFTGDRTFWVALTNATGAGKLAYPATAAITIVDDDHIDVRPSLSFRLGEGLSLSGGETGVIYRIDYANNLGSPSNWVALTNVMPGNNSQVISAAEPTIGTQRFFRAVRTP